MRGIPTTEGVEITKIEGAEGATPIATGGHTAWAVTPDGTSAQGNKSSDRAMQQTKRGRFTLSQARRR